MSSLLQRLLPPTSLARRLSMQSILFSVGEGTFITGSAVYFTHMVGLSAAQVGLGLTIAGVVTFCFAVPLGRFADNWGPQRTWALAALFEAGLYLAYPWSHGFAAFVAIVIGLALIDTAGRAGRGAYTLDAFAHEDRVRSMAFMRSALNIGFTIGALLGGLALASNSEAAIRAVPLVTAAILALNAVSISRLPRAEHAEQPTGQPVEQYQIISPGVLRNKAFLALSVCDGVLSTHQTLLNLVIPLWLVQQTDAPRVLLAWLFATNTVMAVLLQVPASRGSETVPGALRATRIGTGFFVLSCLIVMSTHETLGWSTIALIWLGHVTITGAELFQSAAAWGFASELSDPRRRGEYQGASQLGATVGSVWAPAAYTFLAVGWGSFGWLVIAACPVLAAIAIHPAARASQLYLDRHGVASLE